MAKEERSAGDFCWFNMLSPAPKDECVFFGELLGWTFTPMPQFHGFGVKVDDLEVGAIFDLASPGAPKGLPPLIGAVVKVDDIEAARAKVKALGGVAKEPMEIPGAGTMCVCTDPTGAELDVWKSKSDARSHGVTIDVHGAPSWYETVTPDVAKASKFYADLFGWKVVPVEVPGMTYTTFEHRGRRIAGMMAPMKQWPIPEDARLRWNVTFTAKDTDATAKRIEPLGGEIVMGPFDIPNVGRSAIAKSKNGVPFSILTYKS